MVIPLLASQDFAPMLTAMSLCQAGYAVRECIVMIGAAEYWKICSVCWKVM